GNLAGIAGIVPDRAYLRRRRAALLGTEGDVADRPEPVGEIAPGGGNEAMGGSQKGAGVQQRAGAVFAVADPQRADIGERIVAIEIGGDAVRRRIVADRNGGGRAMAEAEKD